MAGHALRRESRDSESRQLGNACNSTMRLARSFNNRPLDADAQRLHQSHAALTSEIDATATQLQVARNSPTPAASQYSILPYDYSTGTSRRPIIIECTANEIRFASESVLLTRPGHPGVHAFVQPSPGGGRRAGSVLESARYASRCRRRPLHLACRSAGGERSPTTSPASCSSRSENALVTSWSEPISNSPGPIDAGSDPALSRSRRVMSRRSQSCERPSRRRQFAAGRTAAVHGSARQLLSGRSGPASRRRQ